MEKEAESIFILNNFEQQEWIIEDHARQFDNVLGLTLRSMMFAIEALNLRAQNLKHSQPQTLWYSLL